MIFRTGSILRLAHPGEVIRGDEAGDKCDYEENAEPQADFSQAFRPVKKDPGEAEGGKGGNAHHPVSPPEIAAPLVRIDQIPHQAVPGRIRKAAQNRVEDDGGDQPGDGASLRKERCGEDEKPGQGLTDHSVENDLFAAFEVIEELNGEKLKKRTDKLRERCQERDLRVACLEKDGESAEVALPDARHDRKKQTIPNGKLETPLNLRFRGTVVLWSNFVLQGSFQIAR